MEIDSSRWSDEQRKKAFAKLEELGYVPRKWHGTEAYNGKMLISAFNNGEFCGYDFTSVWVFLGYLTPTFEELMAMTKEDVL